MTKVQKRQQITKTTTYDKRIEPDNKVKAVDILCSLFGDLVCFISFQIKKN